MKRTFPYIILFLTAFCIHSAAFARGPEHYAQESKLARGKWVKINVEKSGMQFVSKATLASMGFADPSKVNAYGFGGALISENLHDPHPDDLPQLPTLKSARGIVFFATGNTCWTINSNSNGMFFSSETNPYSDDSWYFLSDIDAPEIQLPDAPTAASAAGRTDRFTARLLHEKDLGAPHNSGRILLGEDFRSPSTQSFSFQLTDNADGNAMVKTVFSSRTTSGPASLMFAANGQRLPSNSADQIPQASASDQFMRQATSVKTVTGTGNSLQFQISYQASGTIHMARLDYIHVEYSRRLQLRDNQLHFWSTSGEPTLMTVAGTDSSTLVWDVTDPTAPMLVSTSAGNGSLSFVAPGGYREYIAFNPATAGFALSRSEAVSNQNVHAMETPDMLIVSPNEYLAPSNRLADHHRTVDSFKVAVVTPQQLYNEFSSGTPDVSAIRKALKMWHDRAQAEGAEGPRYCLIMARPTFDHKTASTKPSYPLVPIWLSRYGFSETTSYSTDDFVGMLDDSSPVFDMARAKIDVAVGRFPVISLQEANDMVDKVIKYTTEPEYGAWRNNIMIIADDQDNGVHLSQAENVYNGMTSAGNGSSFMYERLYLDSYPLMPAATGNTYPAAKERMLKLWNEGVMYIDYIGHASPKEWGHENLLNWNDINAFSNTRLPFIYAATCEFARWDATDRSGAEVLWLYPSSGIIATICPSRTVYISQNGTLNTASHKQIFERRPDGKGLRIGDIMRNGKNNMTSADDNKLRYALMGDPAMRLPSPPHSVEVEQLMGTDLTTADHDSPVLPARGRAHVSGSITGPDGSVDSGFNGVLEIKLLDAESPVETYGNGDNGRVMIYNDRKTRLYSGSTRVKNGKWETTILMPSEIENNYSPAKIVLYAWSDNGVEANGACDSFYVYGYDENAPADNDGPQIKSFVLNRDDFTDGDLVHTSPVVLASFADESGINLSDAGIGHKITLKLDEATYYDDVNSYFMSDPDDMTSGSIAYPLSDLAPGDHTLQLTVWDNANNSSTSSIAFTVGAAKEPVIYSLDTDVNPARDKVNFLLSTDRPMSRIDCTVEVFDLNGRTVWRSSDNMSTDITAGLRIQWDLNDASGCRVARGIYLYRATITSPEGMTKTASKKLAVTAP